jgi:NAD(P)-dependent dehydrogenase (short-subunit alcohol dehydrogenase family)
MSADWKNAWIAGADAGLGRALALALARRGVAVAASAPAREALEALAAEAAPSRADGSARILPTPLDLGDRTAVKAAAEAALRVFRGPPDLAVLCGASPAPISAGTFDAGRLREAVEANLMPAAHLLEALLPACLAARRGQIAIVLARDAGHGAGDAVAAALASLCRSLRAGLDGAALRLQLLHVAGAEPLPADRLIAALASDRPEIELRERRPLLRRAMRLLPLFRGR